MYGLQKGSELMEAFVETADDNIVDWYRVVREEVHLDKLKAQIDKAQARIDNMPELMAYPPGASDEVRRAIDLWNTQVVPTDDLERYLAKLRELQENAVGSHI